MSFERGAAGGRQRGLPTVFSCVQTTVAVALPFHSNSFCGELKIHEMLPSEKNCWVKVLKY